jgi:hypothetical protein
MDSKEFNKVISDLVINLEKAGVYNSELKTTIDLLFELKDLVGIKDSVKQDNSTCLTCKYYENGYCTYISGVVSDSVKIELFKPDSKRMKIKVPPTFRCKFFKF